MFNSLVIAFVEEPIAKAIKVMKEITKPIAKAIDVNKQRLKVIDS